MPGLKFYMNHRHNQNLSETNQTLDITMAPLQNFFLDNKEWDYVEYDYSDIKDLKQFRMGFVFYIF